MVLSLLMVMNRMTDLQEEVDYVSQHDMAVNDLAIYFKKHTGNGNRHERVCNRGNMKSISIPII